MPKAESTEKGFITPRGFAAAAIFAIVAAAVPMDAQSTLDLGPSRSGGAPALPDARPAPPAGPAAGSLEAVPRAFRRIELGMDRDAVIAELQKESLFLYRGPEDVSLLPSPNQSLIDVAGISFVKRAYFQFYSGALWVMIYVLDPEKIDHYTIFTSLSAKYGNPAILDPRESRWEDGATRLALERPLSLRYVDMAVLAKLAEGARAAESAAEIDRADFLGGL